KIVSIERRVFCGRVTDFMDQSNAAEQAFLMQRFLEFLHKLCKLHANAWIVPFDYLKVDDDARVPSRARPVYDGTDKSCRLCRAGNLWLGGRPVDVLRKILVGPGAIYSYC